ncbi:MAG: MBL fold metallo-hydrolase [Bacteroidota bacterium]
MISKFLTLAILLILPQYGYSQAGDHMQLVLLGTGTPNADPDRFGPAVAVVVGDQPYLVDFGPGVVRRAAAAAAAGVEGLKVENLTRAFLTHLHSDHTTGYADLIFTPWVLERRQPLEVYGPEGLQDMTDHIVAAYSEDIAMRKYGLEPRDDVGYKVLVTELDTGFVYKDDHVRVTPIPVPHSSWPHAFGYKFEAGGKSIVISGDTTPSDALVAACNGCDILVHEVYSAEQFKSRPAAWQRYHKDSHTSTIELAEIANRAKPGLLVLYHQLFWGASEEEMLAEIKAHYDGAVVSGKDLDVYTP